MKNMKNENRTGMAERIKEQRKKTGLTQEEISERLDISSSSYTKIENAFQNPSLDTLVKIALELNLSLDYIVFGSRQEEMEREAHRNRIASTVVKIADAEKISHTIEILNKLVSALEQYEG